MLEEGTVYYAFLIKNVDSNYLAKLKLNKIESSVNSRSVQQLDI